ncbi:MAG: BatD family protein [Flavobacteriales bacterium]|nr:BatD family protein [Flavobacteriales bacterium]
MKSALHKTSWIRCWVFSVLMLTGWGIHAQMSFDVSVNRNPVPYGQNVQLTFALENFRVSVDPPKIIGLKFRGGPSTNQSNSWVNGKSSSSISYTFTYQVVIQKDIQVPSMTITSPEGRIKSKPFILKVIPGGKNQAKANKKGLGELACVIEVSDKDVFIGEPIVASFKIFNRANNLDVREYVVPEMPGFWKEEIGQPDPSWVPQVISGQRYSVANVKTVVLFPQQTGNLTLEGFNLTGYLRTSFFDGRNVSVQAPPVKIKVRPLPEPVPSDFVGTFKRLNVQIKVSESETKENEAVTVEIKYSGQGNLKFIQEPKLNWPGEFEVFDPEAKDRIAINVNGESGSRTFRYVVIPRGPGEYKLPSVSGQWFNYRTRSYQPIQTDGPRLMVSRDETLPESTMSYNSKTDIQVLNQDIRYIQTDWNNPLPRAKWESHRIFTAGTLTMGPMVLFLAWFFRRRKEENDRDINGYRKKKARSALRQELRSAKQFVQDPDAFYPALGNGLEAYLLAKLSWSASQNQRAALNHALQTHVADHAAAWSELLEQLDMARFSPGSIPPPATLLDEASKLVELTEKAWKA